MIKSLSKEQSDLLPVYRDKWLKIGLCTEPADRKTAEEGVIMAYKAAKLQPPDDIRWVDSPIAGVRLVEELTSIKSQVNTIWGHMEAGWLGYMEYFYEVLHVKDIEPIQGLIKIAKSAGWMWPFDKLVIISERPVAIHMDDNNRLHHESRAAVEYKDGFGVYSWHGVRVPKDIITEPDKINVARIDAETNAEIRRILMTRMGEGTYIEQSGLKPTQKDQFGELYRKPVDEDEDLVLVKVLNSTPEPDGTTKVYWLRVPPTITTAKEAVAWTFNLDKKDYEPEVET